MSGLSFCDGNGDGVGLGLLWMILYVCVYACCGSVGILLDDDGKETLNVSTVKEIYFGGCGNAVLSSSSSGSMLIWGLDA